MVFPSSSAPLWVNRFLPRPARAAHTAGVAAHTTGGARPAADRAHPSHIVPVRGGGDKCRPLAGRAAAVRAGLYRHALGLTLGEMSTAIEFVIVIMLPTAIGGAVIGIVRASRWIAAHRQPSAAGQVTVEPIERVGARLRRLRAQLESLETATGVPAKALRLAALRAAYTDALGSACARLGVSPPAGGERAPQAEIYRAESALRQRGLDVREPTRN
jgi:hypothetical protein